MQVWPLTQKCLYCAVMHFTWDNSSFNHEYLEQLGALKTRPKYSIATDHHGSRMTITDDSFTEEAGSVNNLTSSVLDLELMAMSS